MVTKPEHAAPAFFRLVQNALGNVNALLIYNILKFSIYEKKAEEESGHFKHTAGKENDKVIQEIRIINGRSQCWRNLYLRDSIRLRAFTALASTPPTSGSHLFYCATGTLSS